MRILGGANYIRTKNCSNSDIIFDRSEVIKIDLSVLRLILCIGDDRITSHHMCKVGGRFEVFLWCKQSHHDTFFFVNQNV